MKKIFGCIKYNPLFSGIGYSEFEKMFSCIEARVQRYKKSDVILLSGDTVSFVGIILSGRANIIKEDINGNNTIIAEVSTSELFGEVFACAGIDHSPVTVQAAEDCEVLFINYKKVISTCSSACGFHSRLIENMLRLIAKKNLMLNQKIEILSKRTTREKLLLFLETQRGNAINGGAKKLTIPFSREEMSQYLCVDRSAMSNELSKMRDEGLIKFNRNEFEIL